MASIAMVEAVRERHGLVRLDALRTGWNAALNIVSVRDRRWGLGRREEVARQGFDSRSRRMRGIHLASCAAAFRGGNCDPTQITLSRPA